MTPNNPTPPPPAHSAGRLTLTETYRILDETGEALLLDGVALTTGSHRPSRHLARANSRRLVALWNACEAIPTAALEAGAVERLVEAAREALAAVDEAYKATGYFKIAETSHQRLTIEAALAQVAGQEGKTNG